jgi:hypothetical protein
MVTVQPPVLFVVVVNALPEAQLTEIAPLTIGSPTAAVPLRFVAAGVLLPPPQAVSSAAEASTTEPKERQLFDALVAMRLLLRLNSSTSPTAFL